MHPIAVYIRDTADTSADFARRVGVTPDLIEEIIADETVPEPGLARRMAAATGGAVSFEQLMNGRTSVVADFQSRATRETGLDLTRLSGAIGEAVRKAAGPVYVPRSDFDIAAEAVAHTYAALAPVTTLSGSGRLVQALRPILQEILKDRGVPPKDPAALDEAAHWAIRRYHRV